MEGLIENTEGLIVNTEGLSQNSEQKQEGLSEYTEFWVIETRTWRPFFYLENPKQKRWRLNPEYLQISSQSNCKKSKVKCIKNYPLLYFIIYRIF